MGSVEIAEAPDGDVGTLRILIAEEKDLVAARLEGQVRALGHRVLAVIRDGPAAAELAHRSQPDLILLGQHIPPHDGIEAAQAILARRVTPLILLVGYPSAGLVRRAREVGILSYLVWPADGAALASAINVALIRFREFRVLCEQDGDLHTALRTRMVVERAKKLLVHRLGVMEPDTFSYLHGQSRLTGKPLGEVAGSLATAERLLFGKPDLAGCVDTILRVLARHEVPGISGSPGLPG